MNAHMLKDMERLLDLKYQKKQQGYAKLLAEESRLRGEFAKLEEQDKEATARQSHETRAIGADVVWKAWLERTRRALNMELAQVLARKDELRRSVQKEYGKVLVARDLVRNQVSFETNQTRTQSLQQSIDADVHRNLKTRR